MGIPDARPEFTLVTDIPPFTLATDTLLASVTTPTALRPSGDRSGYSAEALGQGESGLEGPGQSIGQSLRKRDLHLIALDDEQRVVSQGFLCA